MSFDIGTLILRLVLGVLMVGHGSQKLFGWFGGAGIGGTAGWLASFGLRPARFWAVLAGLVEFVGGILLALGLLNPLGSVFITASMIAAIVLVHWPRVWVTEGGLEYPLVNIAATAAVALAGPGRYSLDAAMGITLPMPATYLLGLVVVVAVLAVAMITARPPARAEQGEERRAA